MMPIKGDVLRASDLAFRNGQIQSGLNADFIDGVSIEDLALSNHNHDTVYLKLIGGTMTGDLTLDKKSVIVTNPNNSSATLSMGWLGDSPRLKVGGSGTGSTGTFKIQNADDSNRMTLDSSGNAIFTGAVSALKFISQTIAYDSRINVLKLDNTAQNINVGGLLVSNNYADAVNQPTNGIYSKGQIRTDGGLLVTGTATFNTSLNLGTGVKLYTPNNAMGIRLGDDAEIGDGNIANCFIIQGVQDPTTAGIVFGSGKDTNLYRSAVSALKTDGSFVVGGSLTVYGIANVVVGGGSRSIAATGFASTYNIQMKSYDNHTWFRNEVGSWTFQSGLAADDRTQSFQFYQPEAGGTPNAVWFEIGQRITNDSTNGGRYRGVRIVKHIGTGGVVDGDLKLGKAFFGNFSIEYNSAQDSLDFVYNG